MASSRKRKQDRDSKAKPNSDTNPTVTPPPLGNKPDAAEAIAKHDSEDAITPGSSMLGSVVAPASGWFAPALSDKSKDNRGESSDIFTNERSRTSSNLHSAMPGDEDQSHVFGNSAVQTGKGPASDILTLSKLASGESDVLGAMMNKSSVRSGDSASRASSVFSDPKNATEPIEMPNLRPGFQSEVVSNDANVPLFDEDERDADDEDDGAVDIGPPRMNRFKNDDIEDCSQSSDNNDATDMMPRPKEEDELDDFTQELFDNGEGSGVNLMDDAPGKDTSRTLAVSRDDSGDDIFEDKTLSEFAGTPSGLNLLNPDLGASKIMTQGPSSGLDLLNPNSGGSSIVTGSQLSGPKSSIHTPGGTKAKLPAKPGPKSSTRLGGPPSGKFTKATTDSGSMITAEDLTKDVRKGAGGSDLFANPAEMSNSNQASGLRSSILPNSPGESVSFDLPDNRIKQPERLRGYEGSGLIDWSEGMGMIDSDQLSQRMNLNELDEDETEHELEVDLTAGIMADKARGIEPESKPMSSIVRPPVAGTASSPALTSQSTGRNKRPEVTTKLATPKKSKDKETDTAKSGGMLVGATLGAFGTAAAVAAAYFGGLMGPGESAIAKEKELQRDVAVLRERVAKFDVKTNRTKGDIEAIRNEKNRETTEKVRLALEKDKADKELATAKRSLSGFNTEKSNLTKERDNAVAEKNKLASAVENAKKGLLAVQTELAEKDKAATEAKNNLLNATTMLKTADESLDRVVKELQAANVLDPKLDRATAIKELPAAIKKAGENGFALNPGSAAVAGAATPAGQLIEFAKVATKAREDAQKAIATAMEEKTKSESELAKAKELVATTTKTLNAKIETLEKNKENEVAKAVSDIKKVFENNLKKAKEDNDRLATEKVNAVAVYEKRMAEQAEQFRKDLAAARAGAILAVSDSDRLVMEKAAKLSSAGISAYFDGRYAEAETALAAATKTDPADARPWYFLGLAQYAQGKTKDAETSFKTGADWEARNSPAAKQVGAALERVQGPARAALDAVRP